MENMIIIFISGVPICCSAEDRRLLPIPNSMYLQCEQLIRSILLMLHAMKYQLHHMIIVFLILTTQNNVRILTDNAEGKVMCQFSMVYGGMLANAMRGGGIGWSGVSRLGISFKRPSIRHDLVMVPGFSIGGIAWIYCCVAVLALAGLFFFSGPPNRGRESRVWKFHFESPSHV